MKMLRKKVKIGFRNWPKKDGAKDKDVRAVLGLYDNKVSIKRAFVVSWVENEINSGEKGEADLISISFNNKIYKKGFDSRFIDGETKVNGGVIGLVNEIKGSFNGFVSGLGNSIGGVARGLIISVILNGIDEFIGVALGMFNFLKEDSIGVLIGGANVVLERFSGFEFGILNLCSRMKGIAIGFINIVEKPSKVLQIGLLNIRFDAPWYARYIPIIAYRYSEKSIHEIKMKKELRKEAMKDELVFSGRILQIFENWYNEIEPSVGKVKELKEWAMKLYDEIRSEEVNQKRLKLEFSRLILKMDKKLNTAEAQPNGLKKPVIIKRDNGSIYREAQIG